jgi:hypothetical protein
MIVTNDVAGASRFGGVPDVPAGFEWPGEDEWCDEQGRKAKREAVAPPGYGQRQFTLVWLLSTLYLPP